MLCNQIAIWVKDRTGIVELIAVSFGYGSAYQVNVVFFGCLRQGICCLAWNGLAVIGEILDAVRAIKAFLINKNQIVLNK